MKLNPNSTRPQIFNGGYEHPWNKHMKEWDAEKELEKRIKKPKPPTPEAIEKAKFKDKTYTWNGR